MQYIPPPGDQAGVGLDAGYVPPVGNAAGMDLGGSVLLVAVESGCVIVVAYGIEVDAGCDIDLAVAGDAVESGCAIVTAIADSEVEAGCELVSAETIDSACLILRTETTPIASSCRIVRREAVGIERVHEIVRHELEVVEAGCELISAFAGAMIEAGCTIDCSHLERTPVEAGCEIITIDGSWSTLVEDRLIWGATVSGAVTAEGRPVANYTTAEIVAGTVIDAGTMTLDPVVLSLTIDRAAYAITGSIELAEAEQYLACAVGRDVALTIGAQTVVLRVSDRRRSRAHGDWRYTVDLASPATWMDAPWADPVGADVGFDGLASVMADAIIATAAHPVEVTWGAIDWSIPADTLLASGRTPLELLRTLKDASGAVMQSELDGSLTIEPEYPVAVPQWSFTAPELTISEGAEVISLDEDDDWRNGANAYLVGSSSGGSLANQLRISAVDNDDGSKTVRVTTVPWRPDIALDHRGGDWVQLELMGDIERDETEVVQIVDGSGTCQYPVRDVLATDWLEYELGSITVAEDGTVTAATVGDSLLSITYRTLAREWVLRNPRAEEVMVVATAGDSASGAGISVLVTRGAGEHQGADVTDPLITTDAVAAERGRNLIDASSTKRQLVTLTCPFSGLHRTGILVEVLDVERPPWIGMLRAQTFTVFVADDGAQTWDTTLTIEREAA